MSSVRRADLEYLERLDAEEGFKKVGSTKTTIQGRAVKEYTLEKKLASTSKMGRGVERVIRGLGCLALPLLIDSKYREETWQASTKGVITRKEVYVTPKPKDVKRASKADKITNKRVLQYDPTDKVSIKAYLERPEIRANLQEEHGNYYLLEERRAGEGITSFLFVPSGDFEKATSVKVWNAQSGKPLENTEQLRRAVRSYCVVYHAVEKGWDTEAQTLLDELVGKDATMAVYTLEMIKKAKKSIVIDPNNHHVRVYGEAPMNLDKNSVYTGTPIDIKDKSIWKDIDTLFDKASTENKKKLDDEYRPYGHLKDPDDKLKQQNTGTPPHMPSGTGDGRKSAWSEAYDEKDEKEQEFMSTQGYDPLGVETVVNDAGQLYYVQTADGEGEGKD